MVANGEAYHTEAMAEQDLQIVQKLKDTGTWPLKRNRVQQFHVGELKRMRLSSVINHQPGKNDVRKACVLCSTTQHKRDTVWKCTVCEVPLCMKPLSKHGGKSCYMKWHEVQNLKQKQTRHSEMLAGKRK